MSDKEFFRAEYRKTGDSDGDECVVPIVWMGNQGFELDAQYGEEGMTAQQHAEWFVSMFKKAIDNYTEQHLEDVLEKAEKMIFKESEAYKDRTAQKLELQRIGFKHGAYWLLNHLKQRKG